MVETLFIIHGETKLNMICPLGGDPERRYGHAYDRDWYKNLTQQLVSTIPNEGQSDMLTSL